MHINMRDLVQRSSPPVLNYVSSFAFRTAIFLQRYAPYYRASLLFREECGMKYMKRKIDINCCSWHFFTRPFARSVVAVEYKVDFHDALLYVLVTARHSRDKCGLWDLLDITGTQVNSSILSRLPLLTYVKRKF